MNRPLISGNATFAVILLAGYMILVGIAIFHVIPASNSKIVDTAMASLGTAVGAAVMALMRSDRNDEARTTNTSKALDAIAAVAANTTPVQQSGESIGGKEQ